MFCKIAYDLFNIFVIMAIFMYIFALLGINLFGGKPDSDIR